MDAKTAAAIDRLKENKDLAKKLMQGGDGQALLSLLSRGDGGAALQRATDAAAHGDTSQLARLLSQAMRSPDAAAIMSRLNDSARR